MFDRRDQEARRRFPAGSNGWGQRQNVGLGATRGEDHVARVCSHQGCDLLARGFDEAAGGAALGMH